MKIKIKTITLTALALIGAGKVCSWIVHGTAWMLVHWGYWDPAGAAAAAPVICLSLGIGLPADLYMMYRENCQYRKNPYGSVDCSSYRQERRKDQERGA